jgi:protein-tyrosine phosphatase
MLHAGAMAPLSKPEPEPPALELPAPRELGVPYRVCLVCLGNICRSPMAETVLRAALTEAGLDGAVVVDSAGTASQFEASWLPRRDLILAMDARNLADLRRMAGAHGRDRIRLFGEVGGLGEAGDAEIPDPYGGDAAEFGYVLDLLRSAAPVIAARLARLLEPNARDAPA